MDLKEERIASGILVKDALEIASEFLDWYIDFLKKHQPHAVNTIKLIEQMQFEMPFEIEELGTDL